jgi:hypothetical protein
MVVGTPQPASKVAGVAATTGFMAFFNSSMLAIAVAPGN